MYAQIVTFRLKPDYSREQFLAITEQMVSWLEQQAGFIAYELYEGDNEWAERIVWDSESSARAGIERLRQTDIASQLLPFVQDDYRRFFGRPVVVTHNQYCDGSPLDRFTMV